MYKRRFHKFICSYNRIYAALMLLCAIVGCGVCSPFAAQAPPAAVTVMSGAQIPLEQGYQSIKAGAPQNAGSANTNLTTPDGTAIFIFSVIPAVVPPALPLPPTIQPKPIEPPMTPAQKRNYDITLLAKLMWGEARGIDSEMEKAAVAWCALNRVSSPHFDGNTVEEVVADEGQFGGYAPNNPVLGNLYSLAEDVYTRWEKECAGRSNVGRVLPKEYCYFYGDGKRNYFVEQIGSASPWAWRLRDPYPQKRSEWLKDYYPTQVELTMMAHIIWHTARNINSKQEQAAVVWCILNRVASGLYPDTVAEVLAQDGQFSKIDLERKIHTKYRELVNDVTRRWRQEMQGETDVGRVLPKEYLYFRGNGKRNIFYKNRGDKTPWKWRLADPYALPTPSPTPQP